MLLGIDLGTSSVKAVIAREDGNILGQGSSAYSISRPEPGYAEQAPDEWWHSAVLAVRQAIIEIPEARSQVAAIGLSGQMHGTVGLDRSLQPVLPAIIWPDQRSKHQVDEITRHIGLSKLVRITGSPVATGFQAATLLWLRQNKPGIWRQIKHVLAPKDFLRLKMTGILGSEPSDGSGTLLFDLRSRTWSQTLLEKVAINPDALPPIAPSSAIAGTLSKQAAEELTLTAGIPVVNGAADTACSLVGAGVVDTSSLLVTISSGGQIILPSGSVKVDEAGRIHTFCSAIDEGSGGAAWYHMAAILSAGMSLSWLQNQILDPDGYMTTEQLTGKAAATQPGAGGLLFLPYLVGERTPYMDPDARGMFLGLTASHNRDHFVRAVMEGVTMACYDAYSVLDELGGSPERLIMAGGGSKSKLWCQILADIFDRPVSPLLVEDQSAAGACLLAGAGIGRFELEAAARSWSRFAPTVDPIPANTHLYQQLFAIFQEAYRKHVSDFQLLNSLPPAG